MYGQGYPPPSAPPQRGASATVIALRVLFAVLPLLSVGLLVWVTALRIALLTRRVIDWILLAVSVAVVIAGVVLIPEDPEDTSADWVVGMILLNAVAFTVYFLVVDIRRGRAPGRSVPVPAPYHPYAATVPQHHPLPQVQHQPQGQPFGYGYPQAQPAAPAAPAAPPPEAPVARPAPVQQHVPSPIPAPSPVPVPAPIAPSAPIPAPASPRIDQVRAELDELSDLLRTQDDRK
ncbi:hypothetical protein [Streptomyces sp. NPDC090025]|uniref:hypothetical protein n=1 Tax=Streptomyces sp. NPDC090025 TaxID=3365922 RepID=UPI003832B385